MKAIATKLNQTEFLTWIDKELNGYDDNDKCPEYRKLSGQVKFWNPYRGWCPVIFSNTKIEEVFSYRYSKQSIDETEELLKSNNNEFEMPFPADIANQIMNSYPKTEVSLMINRISLIGILNSVRNNLQDWILNIEMKGIKIDEQQFTEQDKEKAKETNTKYQIGKIENFTGTIGESGTFEQPGIAESKESVWNKIFWYIIVALGVLIVGNVISGLILKL